jgi:hypothetical protein
MNNSNGMESQTSLRRGDEPFTVQLIINILVVPKFRCRWQRQIETSGHEYNYSYILVTERATDRFGDLGLQRYQISLFGWHLKYDNVPRTRLYMTTMQIFNWMRHYL